jgi:threonine-phosphate decarboxylase
VSSEVKVMSNNEFKHGGDVYTEGILKRKELIDFSSNINPLGIPAAIKENIESTLLKATRYPDIKYRELTGSLINYLHKYFNYEGNYENFILGNGAVEVIDLVIKSFKSILIAVPSFSEYEEIAEKYNLHISYSCLNEEMDFNYEDICEKFHHAEALMIGNPNNPSGNKIDRNKFLKILEFAERNNKTIIVDEAFIEFTGRSEYSLINEMEKFKCLFIIRAITKFFALPGLRFGYGVSSNIDMISKLKKSLNPWNINCFAEDAAKYALSDEAYICKSIEWIEEEKKYLPERLKEIFFIDKVYNTSCNFVLCKLKGINAEELYEHCLSNSILIRRAYNFRGLDQSFVRFAIKDRGLNDKLLKVLRMRCL